MNSGHASEQITSNLENLFNLNISFWTFLLLISPLIILTAGIGSKFSKSTAITVGEFSVDLIIGAMI